MSNMPPATSTQIPAQINTPLITRLTSIAFFAIVGWLLYRGWVLRSEHYITAEKGVGYAIGIIGGVMMLALLLYPLRKNLKAMRSWGPIRYWFRTHMVLGVLGPSLILFHSNFGFGSLNSNVALICMLLVAASGIVGRFFYTRIHYGLYGRKANLSELGNIARNNRGQLAWLNENSEEFTQHLQAIEDMAMEASPGLLHSSARWLKYIATAWWHRWRLRRILQASIHQSAITQQWDRKTERAQRRQALRYLSTYFAATRKVLEFNFFERLFALWHIVHLPFFFMMLVSGIVHVVAVHMY